MEIVYSVNDIPIRLPDERWDHIVSNRPYMVAYDEAVLTTIERPTVILRGYAGAKIAVQSVGRNRFLHVVYKELSHDDGFIVTAYIARKYNRNQTIWPSRS